MTPDKLVEAVARAMWEADGAEFKDLWSDDLRCYEDQARAAIAVVLEEAAKVAEAQMPVGLADDLLDVGKQLQTRAIAAAIRALVKEPQL